MKRFNLLSTLLIFCTVIFSCKFYKDDFKSPDLKSQSIKFEKNELLSIEIVRNHFFSNNGMTNIIVDSIKVRNISHTDMTNLDLLVNFYSKTDFLNKNLLLSYRINNNVTDSIHLKAGEQQIFFLDENARIKMDNSLADIFVLATGNNFDYHGSGSYNSYYNYYKIDTINKTVENYDTTYYENGTASCIIDHKGNLQIKPDNSTIYSLITGNMNLDKHFLGRIQNGVDTIGIITTKPIDFPNSLNATTTNIFSVKDMTSTELNLNEIHFVFFKN